MRDPGPDTESTLDVDPFVSEFKYWRDVRGMSQSAAAKVMGYHRTYVSKIESAQERPTTDFALRAEDVFKTGGALLRAYREGEDGRRAPDHARTPRPPDLPDPAGSLVVEHDHAALSYDGEAYRATQRRTLYNGGSEPVASYLIRISVDRYPGSPERSNRLYREDPLTWDELGLVAVHAGRDPMRWRVQHDRDAFKELWLLFENDQSRFPLYPGESTTIEYSYTVSDTKWGHWFQRAVRLPTRLLSVELDFPIDLDAAVWGTETTMTAATLPLRTAIQCSRHAERATWSWSTADPPLHARYRLEWNFRARPDSPVAADPTPSPSETMGSFGIVQEGDPVLERVARPFDLPAEAEDARRVVAQLHSTMERVAAAHTFSKGMGLAAPQIGIDRAAAVVRSPGGDAVTLLNAKIIDESADTDEQYEGCLSFFDVRGMVPRAHIIHVEHQDIDGRHRITMFEKGMARLVAHEVDHLQGLLYRSRMGAGVEPIPVSEYRGTGTSWRYR
jgi:peptide deformylase